ncbi:MAG TPA: 30S ribosomal protein S6 [Smithellaceae bacterium]|nr:30S ribosomal protein S6 [Smithellaceae bacterium]
MNRYEIVVIVKADLAEEEITKLTERSQTIITERKGFIAKVDKWGKKRLAYEINKQKDGFYFFIDFVGNGAIVAEIERNLRIDDRILKFMTIKKDGALTPEGIEKEQTVVEIKRTPLIIEQDSSAAVNSAEQKPAAETKPRAAAAKTISKETNKKEE